MINLQKKLLNKVIYRNTTRNPENKIEILVYNGDKKLVKNTSLRSSISLW